MPVPTADVSPVKVRQDDGVGREAPLMGVDGSWALLGPQGGRRPLSEGDPGAATLPSQDRHESQLFSGPHRVGPVQAGNPVDDGLNLCDEGLAPPYHVGENAGHLAPLPGRPPTGLLLQDPERHKIFWMDLGVGLQELVKHGVCVGLGECRTKSSRRDQLVIEITSRLALS